MIPLMLLTPGHALPWPVALQAAACKPGVETAKVSSTEGAATHKALKRGHLQCAQDNRVLHALVRSTEAVMGSLVPVPSLAALTNVPLQLMSGLRSQTWIHEGHAKNGKNLNTLYQPQRHKVQRHRDPHVKEVLTDVGQSHRTLSSPRSQRHGKRLSPMT